MVRTGSLCNTFFEKANDYRKHREICKASRVDSSESKWEAPHWGDDIVSSLWRHRAAN